MKKPEEGDVIMQRIFRLADRLFKGLQSLSGKLSRSLDRAIYKLDRFRRQLVLQFYRALHVMEKLFRVVWGIVKILVPILATFIPPFLGLAGAFFLFPSLSVDSIICLACSALLFMILIFAYISTGEAEDTNYKVLQAQERIAYITDISEYSLATKLFGGAIAVGVFLALLFYIPGLFLGILLFLVEFAIILLLPKIMPGQDKPRDPNSGQASAEAV